MVKYRKPLKRNPIEVALESFAAGGAGANLDAHAQKVIDFLSTKYGLRDIAPVAGIGYNMFWVANLGPRKIFIKTGTHDGIYENEYKMGMALYKADPKHFLEPLMYNDYDEIKFFANEYVSGKTLKTVMMGGGVANETRARMIEDLYKIFCALRGSDVVHRDIRPDNLMWLGDRLVLIDFQLAVSKSHYQELAYLASKPQRLRSLGEDVFRYKRYTWDDAHSILRVLEYIGRADTYGARYDEIHADIKSHIGVDTIHSSVKEQPFRRLARHILPKKFRQRLAHTSRH